MAIRLELLMTLQYKLFNFCHHTREPFSNVYYPLFCYVVVQTKLLQVTLDLKLLSVRVVFIKHQYPDLLICEARFESSNKTKFCRIFKGTHEQGRNSVKPKIILPAVLLAGLNFDHDRLLQITKGLVSFFEGASHISNLAQIKLLIISLSTIWVSLERGLRVYCAITQISRTFRNTSKINGVLRIKFLG